MTVHACRTINNKRHKSKYAAAYLVIVAANISFFSQSKQKTVIFPEFTSFSGDSHFQYTVAQKYEQKNFPCNFLTTFYIN